MDTTPNISISEAIHINRITTRKYARRACEYCRKSHRKCDDQTVCKNCQNNRSDCVRKPSTTKRGPKKHNNGDDNNNNNYDGNEL